MVQVVFHGMLLVENFEILYACRHRVTLVFHSNSEDVRLGVASVVSSKEFVVGPVRGIQSLGAVQCEETTAVVDKVPNGLLLLVSHPLDVGFAIAVGPVHAVAQDDEQTMFLERFAV